MLRTIIGTAAGFVAGILAIALISYIGGLFYSIPLDSGAGGTIEQAAAALQNAPLGAKLFIALSWFAGGLVGAWLGRVIARSVAIGWTVAAMLAILTLLNIFIVPYPAWMQIATVAMPLLGGLAGSHLPAPGTRARETEGGTAAGG